MVKRATDSTISENEKTDADLLGDVPSPAKGRDRGGVLAFILLP
jgi:hypothetical protein